MEEAYSTEVLAKRIKELSKNRGYTVVSVFQKAGLGKNTMPHIIDGSFLKSNSLAAVADVLNCTMDYLIGRSEIIVPDESLSHEEAELLRNFRQLNGEAKNSIRMAASAFVSAGMVEKSEPEIEVAI